VDIGITDEVEDVVTALESGTEMKPEIDHRLEVDGPARTDEGAGPQGQHSCVPTRLLHDEVEVVVGLQVRAVVPTPPEFECLPGHGLMTHEIELHHHAFGQPGSEPFDVLPE